MLLVPTSQPDMFLIQDYAGRICLSPVPIWPPSFGWSGAGTRDEDRELDLLPLLTFDSEGLRPE